MVDERDQAGEARPGLTGRGRDVSGMEAGTTGSAAMGDRGLGEAHAGLHSGPGERYDGIAFATGAGEAERAEAMRGGGGVRQRAGELRDRAGDLAGGLGSRASDLASAAGDRVGGVRRRAHEELEKRGLLDRIRENPLPLLGVAFAFGFILAGGESRADGTPSTRAQRARRELRGALMAGLSAGLAQGARGFLQQAGDQGGGFVDSLVRSFLGEEQGGGTASGSPRPGAASAGGGTARSMAGTAPSAGRTGAGQRRPSHQERW